MFWVAIVSGFVITIFAWVGTYIIPGLLGSAVALSGVPVGILICLVGAHCLQRQKR